MIKILESIYQHTTSSLAETPDDIIELLAGVRQGGPESPPLFDLYMDFVMRVFNEECMCQNVKFLELIYRITSTATTRLDRQQPYNGSHSVDWVGYAGDIEMFFENVENIQKCITLIDQIFKKFNLNINVSKTKTMIFNFNCNYENLEQYPDTISSLNGKPIENVKSFKYLGDIIKCESHQQVMLNLNYALY